MLRMAQVQYIKDLYENEEKSLREISRITGHSFETVQKYAQKENWNEDNLPDTEPTSYPVLGEFIPIVDGWLEADRKVPRKQRHTAWRLFCRLRDEYGFRGSYSSVKRYVRKKKYVMKVQSAGFLPLERTPGCGQVDFGEFLYYDAGGQEQKGYALTISFPHSNMGYTQAFPSQNQECLLEGMKRIFEHMGGVPPRLRFDNMTTAVAQVLRGTERSLTEGFSRFMMHYRFQAEFCNPASGNEKGNVENKVGYSRRNAFVPVPTITSFEKFNEEYLWGWCEKDAQRDHYIHKVPILELWQADADALLNLPDYPFTVFRYSTLTVSKTGFVVIDTNRYGLSPVLAGGVFVLLVGTLPDYCAFESEDADDDRDHNNFIGSNVKRVVDEWLHRHKILSEAALALPIDLTSMDGMTDYGMPNVYGRILTVDEYRKYRRFIPLTDKPFWTATPWCTRSSYSSDNSLAFYVRSGGSVNRYGACYASLCARPALALKSSLLVSVEAENGEKALCDYTDTELLDELLRRRTEKKEVR